MTTSYCRVRGPVHGKKGDRAPRASPPHLPSGIVSPSKHSSFERLNSSEMQSFTSSRSSFSLRNVVDDVLMVVVPEKKTKGGSKQKEGEEEETHVIRVDVGRRDRNKALVSSSCPQSPVSEFSITKACGTDPDDRGESEEEEDSKTLSKTTSSTNLRKQDTLTKRKKTRRKSKKKEKRVIGGGKYRRHSDSAPHRDHKSRGTSTSLLRQQLQGKRKCFAQCANQGEANEFDAVSSAVNIRPRRSSPSTHHGFLSERSVAARRQRIRRVSESAAHPTRATEVSASAWLAPLAEVLQEQEQELQWMTCSNCQKSFVGSEEHCFDAQLRFCTGECRFSLVIRRHNKTRQERHEAHRQRQLQRLREQEEELCTAGHRRNRSRERAVSAYSEEQARHLGVHSSME